MTEVIANLCLIKLKYLTHGNHQNTGFSTTIRFIIFPSPSGHFSWVEEGLKWLELAQRWLLQNYDVTITHSQLVVF